VRGWGGHEEVDQSNFTKKARVSQDTRAPFVNRDYVTLEFK